MSELIAAPPETTPPSPVATSPSKGKKWVTRVGAITLSLMIIYIFFGSGHPQKPIQQATDQALTPAIKAPQLPSSNDPMNKLSSLQNLQNGQSPAEQQQQDKLFKMRMIAPTTVYSATTGTNTTSTSISNHAANVNPGVLSGNDADSQFMSSVSATSAPSVEATRIAHPATTLSQGTMIWATLETRIASDLQGMVRAVTSENIYSDDGSQVLLPKGSRLIGQYSSGIAQGQNRVFVVWQRVIRPDHIDIQLNSPGTDPLGAAGMGADAMDRHFFAQFGTAALLSIIGAGAANIGVNSGDQYNSASSYRSAIANSFSQSAQNSLQSTGVIKPTIYINQGKAISVFVARDLDFYDQLTASQRADK